MVLFCMKSALSAVEEAGDGRGALTASLWDGQLHPVGEEQTH